MILEAVAVCIVSIWIGREEFVPPTIGLTRMILCNGFNFRIDNRTRYRLTLCVRIARIYTCIFLRKGKLISIIVGDRIQRIIRVIVYIKLPTVRNTVVIGIRTMNGTGLGNNIPICLMRFIRACERVVRICFAANEIKGQVRECRVYRVCSNR